MPVTFNPGPSEIPPETLRDLEDIARSGLLSASHRGERVRAVLKDTVAAMREAMAVPPDHGIVFQPSATAAMEMILRSCVRRRSHHFVAGAFAGRFADTADAIGLHATRTESATSEPVPWDETDIAGDIELIALTDNETSTGQRWPTADREALARRYPDALVAVDVTSSFGAFAMDWTTADLFFGSVQKCLGCPAGLGFVIASPRAVERAREARGVAPWQSLEQLAERIREGATVETPNVLGIALLGRVMARWDLTAAEQRVRAHAEAVWEAPLAARFHVDNPAWRSPTVHNLAVDDPARWLRRAADAGFQLGRGYGALADTCVRIATFPAHRPEDVARLLSALAG